MNFGINLMDCSLNLVCFVAVGSLLVLGPAWGQTPNEAPVHGTVRAMMDIAKDEPKRGDRLVADATLPPPPPDGPGSKCDGPPPGAGGRSHMGAPPFGPGHLAMALGAMETEIGIRDNQLDAWRDFTDALLKVTAPPSPPSRPVGYAPGTSPTERASEPFEHARLLANDAIARGRGGEALLKAIEVLSSKLTPEQLAKVAMLEAQLDGLGHGPKPPFGPPPSGFGPPPSGFGPRHDGRAPDCPTEGLQPPAQ